jgi:hypothetical protein
MGFGGSQTCGVGLAVNLGGDGYPYRYSAQAAHLVPSVLSGPPEAYPTWICDPYDVVTSEWAGKTVVDRQAAEDCRSEEWLLVVAWDES